MRNTRKIFVALVLVLAMMMSVATLFASAEGQPETLYLTPNSNWKVDNARFAAYFFGNGETWVSMTDSNGDGIYEVKVPTDKVYPNVIFCRMNPSASANNWNNKWNQTADLTIPTSGANHYTVKEGTWDSGGGTWSTYGSTCLHTNLSAEATCTAPQTCLDCGDPVVSALGHTYNSAHLCTRCGEQATFTVAGTGAHMGTEWDTGNTANDMTYDAETGTYVKVYEKVAAGSYKFKVARDHDWGTAYPSADKSYTVAEAGSTVTITLKGTTVNVTVELPAPDHQHVFVDGKCECGESDPNYVPETPDHQHVFVDGKCECGETDPNYVPPVTDVTYTIAGTGAHLGTEWDPANTANDLVKGEDGLYTKVYENVNAGSYELKVAENHSWDVSYGADGGSANLAFSVENDGSTLTVSFDPATKLITVYIDYTAPDHQHVFVDGKCECGETDPNYTPDEPEILEYYLVGYINGADYGCADDYATIGDYKFVDGKLTVTFEAADNYVFVKAGDNEHWYMASAYCQDTTVTLANTETGTAEKLYVPGGVELTFTLVVNEDDTLTLSYTVGETQAPEHTHSFVDGKCECGETDPNYTPEKPENPDPEQPDPENPDPEQPDPEQPAPELSLFQKIIKAVTDFFANIANWFKNLFAGFKK